MLSKRCIIILGMHRSGTSALANLIASSGYELGNTPMEKSYDNPLGFYESEAIVRFNDQVLKDHGSSWDDIRPSQFKLTEDYKTTAKRIILDEFSGKEKIVIKDPRITLFPQFWKEVLTELGYRCDFLLMMRKPLGIAASLESRNNFSFLKSNALILKYWIKALIFGAENDLVLIDYNHLIADPKEAIRNLSLVNIEGLNPDVIDGELNHQGDERVFESLRETDKLYTKLKSFKIAKIDINAYKQFYQKLPFKEIEDISSNESDFGKILFDSAYGYSNNNSLKFDIENGTVRENFSIDNLETSSIKIFLRHEPCLVNIQNLRVLSKGQVVSYRLKTNGFKSAHDRIIFEDDRPFVELLFDKAIVVTEIIMSIDYEDQGASSAILDIPKNIDSKWSLFLNMMLLAVKQPVSLFKHLNKENLRTLRSALKRESPRTILRNFKKLLSTKESSLSSQPRRINPIENRVKHVNVIYYICSILPNDSRSSGEQRAVRILEILNAAAQVKVFYNKATNNDLSELTYLKHTSCHSIQDIESHLIYDKASLSAVIYNKYYTLLDNKGVKEQSPFSKHIVDAEDVAWVRESRSLDFDEYLNADLVERNKKREVESYALADSIWAVTEEDRQAILAELEKKISIVSNIHDFQKNQFVQSDSSKLLFFANYKHEPNVASVNYIVKELIPRLRKLKIDFKIVLAGSSIELVNELVKDIKEIDVIGYVPNEDVSQLYESSKLVIAPLLYGAGIKGKITEAISYMKPVLTTDIGNEGLNLEHGKSILLANDSMAMAEVIAKVFSGEYDLSQMCLNAQIEVASLLSVESNRSRIIKSIFPLVQISIVTYNRVDLLKTCIESIIKNTIYPNYCICVYSNGCTDGTLSYLESISESIPLEIIRSKSNDVYVEPNNAMMQKMSEGDVVLLNNDVEVGKAWLTELVHAGRNFPDAGIIGSLIMYPNNLIQEFGSEIYDDGMGLNMFNKDAGDIQLPAYQWASYVSGCCMYIKASTLRIMKGFDMQFAPCYFEDSDMCYTAWSKGIKTLVASKSRIVHLEGATAGVDEEGGFKKYQSINREKFVMKHGGSIDKINRLVRNLNADFSK